MEILGLVNMPIWVMILLVILYLYYRYATREFDVFNRMGVSGPKPWPVVGSIVTTVKMGFVESYEHWSRKYGRVFGHFEGMYPMLIVGDLDMLKEITVKQFSNFPNRMTFRMDEVADPPGSKFLTFLKDDQWRHNRNALTPSFSGGKLKKMTNLIIEAGETCAAALKGKADSGEPLEMKQYTGAFTMDVIASTAFGIKLNTQASSEDPFIKYAKKFFEFSFLSLDSIIILFFPFLTPLIKLFKLEVLPRDSIKFFTKVVKQAMEERRHNPGKYSDFLQLMINTENEAQTALNETVQNRSSNYSLWKNKLKRPGLTDTEIMAASIIFFVAGYDTTASTLAHLFYHLAMNLDHQDKLIAEIDQHFPQGNSLDYDSIHSLPYLDMVVHEGLRINPPIARMDRVCSHETTVNGITIPAGMGVALPIYMIHHDPGYWADPEVFDPERFTPEKKANYHPLQWIPFGYGPRNCIGMRLALLEMKVFIVQVLRKYRFVPNSKTKPLKFHSHEILTDAKDGVWLTIQSR